MMEQLQAWWIKLQHYPTEDLITIGIVVFFFEYFTIKIENALNDIRAIRKITERYTKDDE